MVYRLSKGCGSTLGTRPGMQMTFEIAPSRHVEESLKSDRIDDARHRPAERQNHLTIRVSGGSSFCIFSIQQPLQVRRRLPFKKSLSGGLGPMGLLLLVRRRPLHVTPRADDVRRQENEQVCLVAAPAALPEKPAEQRQIAQ